MVGLAQLRDLNRRQSLSWPGRRQPHRASSLDIPQCSISRQGTQRRFVEEADKVLESVVTHIGTVRDNSKLDAQLKALLASVAGGPKS